ncbi:hypothetical protein [Deinococcus planocerae]|uniref:hypothetical protein n=1 Tax=Deinococcus planocerae TaxID=1737569 RepID=UPI000C7E872C|nr:hypothetical protein [Deinococcus planocerae]
MTDSWDRHLVIGEEITPNKVAVRVDDRFFTVSRTVATQFQALVDGRVTTEQDATVQALHARFSLGQARILSDNLRSFLVPVAPTQQLFQQIRRGFVKLPLYTPGDHFVRQLRGRVITPLSTLLFALMSTATLVICAAKAPHLPMATSLNQFPLPTLIAVWALLTVTTFIHEFGHAVIAAHYGIQPRSMGVALFLLQPAGYVDVSNGWLSSRHHRIMVALGGFIFQMIPLFIASVAWLVTDQALLGLYCLSSIGIMVLNTVPLVRTDGYWILANFINEPNLLQQVTRAGLGVLRAPGSYLTLGVKPQIYAVTGLASIVYTLGMYLLGFGLLVSRLPMTAQRFALPVSAAALLIHAASQGLRRLPRRRPALRRERGTL